MKAHERALIDRFIGILERMDLARYVEHVTNRRRMLLNHLLYGMLRGLGFSIGFTVLGALLVVILRHFFEENIPQISGFIAEVVHAIQERM